MSYLVNNSKQKFSCDEAQYHDTSSIHKQSNQKSSPFHLGRSDFFRDHIRSGLLCVYLVLPIFAVYSSTVRTKKHSTLLCNYHHAINKPILFIPPRTPLVYSKTGVYRGIRYFSYLCSKPRSWTSYVLSKNLKNIIIRQNCSILHSTLCNALLYRTQLAFIILAFKKNHFDLKKWGSNRIPCQMHFLCKQFIISRMFKIFCHVMIKE